ncbi:MAG: DUF5994 family protein [Mycobacterium sp.]
MVSTPTLRAGARQADKAHPATPGGVRLRIKPAHQSRGIVHGAWWPRSRELGTELPALLTTLSPRIGHIDRVSYDETDWATAPPSVRFKGSDVPLDPSDDQSAHTLSMVGGHLERLVLLIVPPFTNPTRAYATVMAAANLDDVSTVGELLGIDAKAARDQRLALLAHQRWESEGGALDRPVSTRAGLLDRLVKRDN